MDEPSWSRREALRGAAGTLAAGSLAGCLDALPFVGGEGDATVDIGPVPQGVDAVIRGDADTVLSDDGFRSGLDGGIGTVVAEGGPQTLGEFVDWLQNIYGLDPAGISRVVGFTDVTPAEPIDSTLGALVEASWTPESIPQKLEAEGFRTSEYTVEGVTVYDIEREISQVAILEAGRYLIGTADAVEKVVAIERGDAASLSGGPLSAYRAAGDGPVRFGIRVEPWIDTITALFPAGGELIGDLLSNVETLGGHLFADGERRGLSARFQVTNDSRGEQFQNVLEAIVAGASSTASEGSTLASALESTTVDRAGAVVTLEYAGSVGDREGEVAALLAFFAGEGVVELPDPEEIDLPDD